MNNAIIWNIVNAVLAGVLVILGACSVGEISLETFIIAVVIGFIVAVNQFKDFWESLEPKRVGAFL